MNSDPISVSLYDFIDCLFNIVSKTGYVTKENAGSKKPTMYRMQETLFVRTYNRVYTRLELDCILDYIENEVARNENSRYVAYAVKLGVNITKSLTTAEREGVQIAFKEIPKLCPIAFAMPKNLPKEIKKPKKEQIDQNPLLLLYVKVIKLTKSPNKLVCRDLYGTFYHITLTFGQIHQVSPNDCIVIKVTDCFYDAIEKVHEANFHSFVKIVPNENDIF